MIDTLVSPYLLTSAGQRPPEVKSRRERGPSGKPWPRLGEVVPRRGGMPMADSCWSSAQAGL